MLSAFRHLELRIYDKKKTNYWLFKEKEIRKDKYFVLLLQEGLQDNYTNVSHGISKFIDFYNHLNVKIKE